jgi:Spy/CpxP family protein refolding chaperone
MNKNILNIAIFGVLCALAGVFVGATIVKYPPMPGPMGPDHQKFSDKADRFMGHKWHKDGKEHGNPIEMIAKELNLNAEQKTKVSNILEKTRSEIDSIGKNLRASIHEIKSKGDQEIMKILDSEQQTKFQSMTKDMEKKFERKRHDWDREKTMPPCPMKEKVSNLNEEIPPQQ